MRYRTTSIGISLPELRTDYETLMERARHEFGLKFYERAASFAYKASVIGRRKPERQNAARFAIRSYVMDDTAGSFLRAIRLCDDFGFEETKKEVSEKVDEKNAARFASGAKILRRRSKDIPTPSYMVDLRDGKTTGNIRLGEEAYSIS